MAFLGKGSKIGDAALILGNQLALRRSEGTRESIGTNAHGYWRKLGKRDSVRGNITTHALALHEYVIGSRQNDPVEKYLECPAANVVKHWIACGAIPRLHQVKLGKRIREPEYEALAIQSGRERGEDCRDELVAHLDSIVTPTAHEAEHLRIVEYTEDVLAHTAKQ